MGCPSSDQLAGFVAGVLAPLEMDPLEGHLDACAPCREVVATLASTSALGAPQAWNYDEKPSEPVPGARIGRFVVLELVGEGGMGAVYAAKDLDLDRKVA